MTTAGVWQRSRRRVSDPVSVHGVGSAHVKDRHEVRARKEKRELQVVPPGLSDRRKWINTLQVEPAAVCCAGHTLGFRVRIINNQ